MNRIKMICIFLGLIGVLFSLPSPVLAKEYTKEQLLEMGGKTMSGTVTKVGVYNFFIETGAGDEVNIHTDNSTIQFVPEDERLMVGDEITFIYLSPESASRSIDKKLAHYVEFIKKVPREFLTEEMECVISLSQRNEKACYLPEYEKVISFEGRWPDGLYQGRKTDTSVGSKIRITLKTVPANIGNGYVYIVKGIKPL